MAEYRLNDWDSFKFPIISLNVLDKGEIINNIETKIENKDAFTNKDLLELALTPILEMDKEKQIANLREIYADVMDYGDLEQEKEKLEGERDAVGEKYRQEIEKNARVAQNQDEYKKREAELAGEYDRLDVEVKSVEAELQKRQSCGRRIEGLISALEEAGEDFTESLWGSMVEKVTVFEDALVFTLTSGEEVRVAP